MEQRVCSYCGNPLEPGTGKMFVRRDGTVLLFDRKRCQVSMLKHGRVARYVKWTRHYPRGGAEETEHVLAEQQAKRAVGMEEAAEAAGLETKKPAKKAPKKAAKKETASEKERPKKKAPSKKDEADGSKAEPAAKKDAAKEETTEAKSS